MFKSLKIKNINFNISIKALIFYSFLVPKYYFKFLRKIPIFRAAKVIKAVF